MYATLALEVKKMSENKDNPLTVATWGKITHELSEFTDKVLKRMPEEDAQKLLGRMNFVKAALQGTLHQGMLVVPINEEFESDFGNSWRIYEELLRYNNEWLTRDPIEMGLMKQFKKSSRPQRFCAQLVHFLDQKPDGSLEDVDSRIRNAGLTLAKLEHFTVLYEKGQKVKLPINWWLPKDLPVYEVSILGSYVHNPSESLQGLWGDSLHFDSTGHPTVTRWRSPGNSLLSQRFGDWILTVQELPPEAEQK